MPKVIPVETKQAFDKLIAAGWRPNEAHKKVGVSYSWAKARAAGRPNNNQVTWRRQAEAAKVGPAKTDLSMEARRARSDFAFFRRRYFGRIASPWQEEAANQVVELLASPRKEFLVVNCPPGSGKSTLFTHDIPAWLVVRNRGVRMILGSRTEKQARVYVGRLGRTLARTFPVQADDDLKAKGRAFDAEATLAQDFGAFRPENPDVWRQDQIIVAQLDDQPIDEKEPTAVAFGQDSGSLGWRVDYVLWDDVVDGSTIRTIDMIEKQRTWWEDEAETRLEPDGLLVLQGQRLSPSDLYRHCLNMRAGGEDDEGEVSDQTPKYRHIVYRAHYEDRCKGEHKPSVAKAYPEGCLLDPIRLPWRELSTIARNRGEKYQILYQQEDVDPQTVLVKKVWIDGGRDEDGSDSPGCWDKTRDLWEIPQGLVGDLILVATADPSPTRFWSIQAWAYHPASEQRFLLDLIRQRMDAPDFLDWNQNGGAFTGIMDEWQQKSRDIGHPFKYWIVEANAAQKFMLQYDHVHRWVAKNNVRIIPHQTHRNKSDPKFGVQTIAPHYQYGRIRLPGKQHTMARPASMKLIDEVTRWPEGETDDCVMAHWFLEWNLPMLTKKYQRKAPVKLARPSWMRAA